MTDLELDRVLGKLDLSTPRDRSDYEFITVRVSKEAGKVLKSLTDLEQVQERILRRHIKHTFNIVEEEVKNLEDVTVLYQSHMMKMSDALVKIEEKYAETIDSLYDSISTKREKLLEVLKNPFKEEVDEVIKNLERVDKQTDVLNNRLQQTSDKLSSLPSTYALKEIVTIVDSWNRLSIESKELLKPLFTSKD